MPPEIKAPLRRPFVDAVDEFERIARDKGFTGTVQELKEVLRSAQQAADERARGVVTRPEDTHIVNLSTQALSYLGQVPPRDLQKALVHRFPRLRSYMERAARDLAVVSSRAREDVEARIDLADLMDLIAERHPGVEVEVALSQCELWAAAVARLVFDFFPAGTLAGGPQ